MSSLFRTLGAPLFLLAGLISGCSQPAAPDSALSHPARAAAPSTERIKPEPTPGPYRVVTVFLPGRDGKLHRAGFRERQDRNQLDQWEERPLALLFRKAPQIIPGNTRLTAPITKNKEYYRQHPGSEIYTVFEVRLNREFGNSPLWKDSRKAKMAFDAIIKTATNSINESRRPTYPFAIHVLIGGKTIKKLGKVKVKNPA